MKILYNKIPSTSNTSICDIRKSEIYFLRKMQFIVYLNKYSSCLMAYNTPSLNP